MFARAALATEYAAADAASPVAVGACEAAVDTELAESVTVCVSQVCGEIIVDVGEHSILSVDLYDRFHICTVFTSFCRA